MNNTISVNGMTSYYSSFIKSVMPQTSVDKESKINSGTVTGDKDSFISALSSKVKTAGSIERATAVSAKDMTLDKIGSIPRKKVFNDTGSHSKNERNVNVSDFKEVETANYKLVPELGIGGLRILVNGESAGVFKPEQINIQEDVRTGTKVMISEMPGLNSQWYDAIPVTDELEKALAEAIGVDEAPHKNLEGYYIGTHTETGIRYVMRPGDEGRGGKVLLCNAADEARYKALGEEYTKKYPNLVASQDAGLFYASLEIRGMAHRGATGIVITHPDNISYNDNDDVKKNWSAKIDEKTWSLMLSWFKNHRLNTEEMSKFKYWDELFGTIGGNYERVWSDDEVRQVHLYQ